MIRITTLATLMALFAVSACNTIAGAGRDLQNAGWTLQSEAQRTGEPTNPTPQPVPGQASQSPTMQ